MIFTVAKLLKVKLTYYFNELEEESAQILLFGFILKVIKQVTSKLPRFILSESMMILYMRLFEVF